MIKSVLNKAKSLIRKAGESLPVVAIVNPARIMEDDVDYLTIKRQQEHVYSDDLRDETTRLIWVVEGKRGKVIYSLDTVWATNGDVHYKESLSVLSRTEPETPRTTEEVDTELYPGLRTEHVSLVFPEMARIYTRELIEGVPAH